MDTDTARLSRKAKRSLDFRQRTLYRCSTCSFEERGNEADDLLCTAACHPLRCAISDRQSSTVFPQIFAEGRYHPKPSRLIHVSHLQMRLLKTKGYQLVEAKDIPTPFPQYAILSHTWISPKDEITYQDFKTRKKDIKNGIFKQQGWAKLRKYCERARNDGWAWAWMDTCCIDKTNPADTQEAINAMFRWYQNASICYAYLEDVDASKYSGSKDGHSEESPDLDNMASRNSIANPKSLSHAAMGESLVKAKWFTRGWTLQELLAPPYLVFVDQEWQRIGTRESWANEIKTVCRIDARHLTSFDPTDFISCSIAMRLSWASDRQTTVEEDETYSLIGLFGISLPLIYGEGRWRAFNRLQRELILVYNDDSIFAWTAGESWNKKYPQSGSKDENTGWGILAPSIREFLDASTIKAFGFYGHRFAMTNKGLEMSCKRWRCVQDSTKCLIRLDCGTPPYGHLGIVLAEVGDSYSRIVVDKLEEDVTRIRSDEWIEDNSREPSFIRASNHSTLLATTSTFVLRYCEDIVAVGSRYSIDFSGSFASGTMERYAGDLEGSNPNKNELSVAPNQLVFINIKIQKGSKNFMYDIVINLTASSFPIIGIWARSDNKWERLEDPLGKAKDVYEALANMLHHQIETEPTYPLIAVEEAESLIIGVCLAPRPPSTDRAGMSTGDEVSLALREYVIDIRVEPEPNKSSEPSVRTRKKRKLRH